MTDSELYETVTPVRDKAVLDIESVATARLKDTVLMVIVRHTTTIPKVITPDYYLMNIEDAFGYYNFYFITRLQHHNAGFNGNHKYRTYKRYE